MLRDAIVADVAAMFEPDDVYADVEVVYGGDQLATLLPGGIIKLHEMLKPEEALISPLLQSYFRGFFGSVDSPDFKPKAVEEFAIGNVSSSLRRKGSHIRLEWEAQRKAKFPVLS